MGIGLIGFAQSYARFRPDILLVLGDRFEMHAAVGAALPFKIPVAHIHGGESTEGLIDEPIRHSITKMSHLHFTSIEYYAQRIIQMGEEPWRVVVSGAPSLDALQMLSFLSRQELDQRYGLNPAVPLLIVTYHPVTLEYETTETQVAELLAAVREVDVQMIFTYPNADTHGRKIIEMIHDFVAQCGHAHVIVNLGPEAYFSFMQHAAAMVGNSSSGIIEAASFKLPVVNIGNRQRGRVRAHNVIDVSCDRSEILAGIRKALSSKFRAELKDLVNPYGDGCATEKIVDKLKKVKINDDLLLKRFYNCQNT
jgi:UDP-hydrolysing UDP-N-acetyl-D-glucosamine 2-epimerase